MQPNVGFVFCVPNVSFVNCILTNTALFLLSRSTNIKYERCSHENWWTDQCDKYWCNLPIINYQACKVWNPNITSQTGRDNGKAGSCDRQDECHEMTTSQAACQGYLHTVVSWLAVMTEEYAQGQLHWWMRKHACDWRITPDWTSNCCIISLWVILKDSWSQSISAIYFPSVWKWKAMLILSYSIHISAMLK